MCPAEETPQLLPVNLKLERDDRVDGWRRPCAYAEWGTLVDDSHHKGSDSGLSGGRVSGNEIDGYKFAGCPSLRDCGEW